MLGNVRVMRIRITQMLSDSMSRRSTSRQGKAISLGFLTRIASILNPSDEVELPFSRNYKNMKKINNSTEQENLLRERKRHTTRRVASTTSAVLSRGGVPHPWSGVLQPGVPTRKGPGISHWGTPWKGHGTSGSIMGWRWSKPPPPGVDRHTHVKIVPSRRTTYAGGKYGKDVKNTCIKDYTRICQMKWRQNPEYNPSQRFWRKYSVLASILILFWFWFLEPFTTKNWFSEV